MTMSRRKQLHPKSMKSKDEIVFVLPGELQYNEQTNEIITRINLEEDHRFGPYPASLQIEDRIESFQLHDIKHNWLAYCSISETFSGNLNLIFQNNQLIVIIKESISIGTRLYSNKIILPRLTMHKAIQIKEEPIETEMKKPSPLSFLCHPCGIRFSNQKTLDVHQEHYCIKHGARKSHSTESTITTAGIKRKSIENLSIIPAKRLSNENHFIEHQIYSSKKNFKSCLLNNNKTIPFTHPIQIGQFIYIPIPIVSAQIDNKSKSKTNERKILPDKLYPCEFCLISFRSLKTLQAHQTNYCIAYQKSKVNEKNLLLKCTICSAMFNIEETLLNHIKYVHTNIRLIECLECRSRFCSKWNLIRHMKLLHTNIKYNDNDQKFSDSIDLITRKYSCPSCHIQFSQLDTLIQHMNNYCSAKSRRTETKTSITYYCSTCEISFQHQTSYEAHKMYYCRNESKLSA